MERKLKISLLVYALIVTLLFFGGWLAVVLVIGNGCDARERSCYISPLDADGACVFYDVKEPNVTRCSIAVCPFNEFDTELKCWMRLEDDHRRCLEPKCTVDDVLQTFRIMLNVLWGFSWSAFTMLGMNLLFNRAETV